MAIKQQKPLIIFFFLQASEKISSQRQTNLLNTQSNPKIGDVNLNVDLNIKLDEVPGIDINKVHGIDLNIDPNMELGEVPTSWYRYERNP